MTSDTSVTAQAGVTPSRRIDMDNLIRRELRIGDPSDPMQVAQALLQRYADTPSARSLSNEAKGLPFLQMPTLSAPTAMPPTATSLDLQQSKDDIEADLRELLTCNLLKDITPELEGWAQAIRAAVADGEGSAAMGIDTAQRDRTFAVRRQLSDYARASRFVGALNPRTNDYFRSLAESLDEAASVLLVMMGDAIANTGIAGGRYLMQVPFSELQSRRQAVLTALRNLNGSSQYAYGPDDFPRGLDAYRQLYDVLERQGQGELRSLLSEAGITRVMDQLIDRAGQGVRGLRALGATVTVELQQFQRLVSALNWMHDEASPPLLGMQDALQLFIDGFRPTGGIRLIGISRPQILNYGLYGNRQLSAPELRLEVLLRLRGALASGVDCYSACICDTPTATAQVLFDQGLQCMDRAIDMYAGGVGDKVAEPEVRASTYGLVLDAIAHHVITLDPQKGGEVAELLLDTNSHPGARTLLFDQLNSTVPNDAAQRLRLHELTVLQHQEGQLHDMVGQMGDNCGVLNKMYEEVAGRSRGEVAAVLSTARRAVDGQDLDVVAQTRIVLPRPLENSNDSQAHSLQSLSDRLHVLTQHLEKGMANFAAPSVFVNVREQPPAGAAPRQQPAAAEPQGVAREAGAEAVNKLTEFAKPGDPIPTTASKRPRAAKKPARGTRGGDRPSTRK